MKRHLMALMVPVAAVFGTAFAQETTVPIAIQNPGFEADAICPGCYDSKVPAWLPAGFAGTIRPSTVQYPSGTIPEGVNVAYLGEPPTSTGSISQTLGATLKANTIYTLRLSVGHRLDEAFTGYMAALTAGNVILACGSSLSPSAGSFLEDVIVFRSGPHPLFLGEPLAISIQSIGTGQVDIDKVSLDATHQ